MALTDVVFFNVSSQASRGDVGAISDSDGLMSHTLYVTIPAIANVATGIVYGRQNSLTGTMSGGGGGGPTYYSYG